MPRKFRKERPPKMLRWFFWDGKLHQTTFIDRPKNILTAWCYPEGKSVQFVYSHIRVHRERAWKQTEVCKLLRRSGTTLDNMVRWKKIPAPYKAVSKNGTSWPGMKFWTAKDIYAAHEYLINLPKARNDTPSRMELVAMMEEGVSYVIEDNQGNRTRAFKEQMW